MMQVTVPEYISKSRLEIPDKKCYTFNNKKYEMIGVLKKQFKTSKYKYIYWESIRIRMTSYKYCKTTAIFQI